MTAWKQLAQDWGSNAAASCGAQGVPTSGGTGDSMAAARRRDAGAWGSAGGRAQEPRPQDGCSPGPESDAGQGRHRGSQGAVSGRHRAAPGHGPRSKAPPSDTDRHVPLAARGLDRDKGSPVSFRRGRLGRGCSAVTAGLTEKREGLENVCSPRSRPAARCRVESGRAVGGGGVGDRRVSVPAHGAALTAAPTAVRSR